MATEQGMRIVRQYSDEGRQLAMRVSFILQIQYKPNCLH